MRLKYSNTGSVGYNKDEVPHDLPPEVWSHAQNARFDYRGAQAVDGDRRVLPAAIIEPKWLMQFPTTKTPKWVYADSSSMWVSDFGSNYNITRGTGPYTGDDSQRWQGNILNGVGIFNNEADKPQQWGIDSAIACEDLENWPDDWRVKVMRAYKNFLIGGNLTTEDGDFPFRIVVSHPAEPGTVPTSWDPFDPAKDAIYRDIAGTPGYIVDFYPMGDVCMIYKEDSTWGMQYIGPPNMWKTWPVLDRHGAMHRDCVTAIPGGHFVLSQDDAVVHNGQRNSQKSVVHKSLRRWMFKQIDKGSYYNTFVTPNRRNKEVWMCFPEAGETYATMAIIWNWEDNTLSVRDLPGIPFMWGGYAQEEASLTGIPWG